MDSLAVTQTAEKESGSLAVAERNTCTKHLISNKGCIEPNINEGKMQRIGKTIALTVTKEQQERVAKIAKKYDLPKAQVYRNMMDVGLDLHDDFERIGFAKLMEFTEKTRTMSKDWMSKRQLKLF